MNCCRGIGLKQASSTNQVQSRDAYRPYQAQQRIGPKGLLHSAPIIPTGVPILLNTPAVPRFYIPLSGAKRTYMNITLASSTFDPHEHSGCCCPQNSTFACSNLLKILESRPG